MRICEICKKPIRQGEGEANDAIGKDEQGLVIFRLTHLDCSLKTSLTEYQQKIIQNEKISLAHRKKKGKRS